MENKEQLCKWTNRGLKSQPYWYLVSCKKQIVNVKKAMTKKRGFLDCCLFCGKVIEWCKPVKK